MSKEARKLKRLAQKAARKVSRGSNKGQKSSGGRSGW